NGTWVDDQTVTRSPCHCATIARGSIGAPCDPSATYRPFTTTSAPAIAASASPFATTEYPRTFPCRPRSSSPSYDSQSAWTSGASAASAASTSVSGGSGSYSTSINPTASSAIAELVAATAA